MKRDDIIFDIIEKEHQRQLKGIELIASENFVSDQVMPVSYTHLDVYKRQARTGYGNLNVFKITHILFDLIIFHLHASLHIRNRNVFHNHNICHIYHSHSNNHTSYCSDPNH